jgi:hypothetical protein
MHKCHIADAGKNMGIYKNKTHVARMKYSVTSPSAHTPAGGVGGGGGLTQGPKGAGAGEDGPRPRHRPVSGLRCDEVDKS